MPSWRAASGSVAAGAIEGLADHALLQRGHGLAEGRARAGHLRLGLGGPLADAGRQVVRVDDLAAAHGGRAADGVVQLARCRASSWADRCVMASSETARAGGLRGRGEGRTRRAMSLLRARSAGTSS